MSPLARYASFGFVRIQPHTQGATTVNLNNPIDSGNLPSVRPFLASSFRSNLYPHPALDPDREVYRCTDVNPGTGVLTVVRGQQGTTAKDHSQANAEYSLIAGAYPANLRAEWNPRDFHPTGVWGTDAVVDTAAVQAACDAAEATEGEVLFDPGTFKLKLVNVGANVKRIKGSGWGTILEQSALSDPIFRFDRTNGCEICDLVGKGIATVNDDNDGDNVFIHVRSLAGTPAISDNKEVCLRRVRIKDFGYCAVHVQYCESLWIEAEISGCSHGLQLWDVKKIRVCRGLIRDSSLTTKLAIGINVATTNLSTSTHNEDVLIADMQISGFHTGESILVHDGINVVLANNVISEALIGIAVQPAGGSTHVIESVVCVGNSVRHRTTSNSATETGNSSYFFGGQSASNRINSVVCANNQSWKANHCKSTAGEGAFKCSGYVRTLSMEGNVAHNPKGAGFTFGNTDASVSLIGNFAFDVDSDGSNQAGFQFRPSCNYKGIARDNYVEDANVGFEVLTDGNCSALHVWEQRFDTVTTDYALSSGASLGRQIIEASATWNPASVAVGGSVTTTITVTGAVINDFSEASFAADLQGLVLTAYVSASNTVTVVLSNPTAGAVDLGSSTLRALVRKAA